MSTWLRAVAALGLLALAIGVTAACGRYGPPRRVEPAVPPPVAAEPNPDVDLHDHEDEEVWHDDDYEGEVGAADGETEDPGW